MKWMVIVFLLALVACTSQIVERGDYVLVTYTGSFENGTIFDSNDPANRHLFPDASSNKFTSMVVQVGGAGTIPGFSEALVGMKEGETKEVLIKSKDAYGSFDPKKVVSVPGELTFDRTAELIREQVRQKEQLPERLNLSVGNTFETENFRYNITNVSDENVTIYMLEPLEDPIRMQNLPWTSSFVRETSTEFHYEHDVEDGDVINLAYGPYDATIQDDEIVLASQLSAGMQVKGDLGTGTVTEIKSGFEIDFNHPLAGRNLLFEITIEAIQE